MAANSATHTARLLQEDDVSLAYEFARKVRIKARREAIMRPTFGFVWQFLLYGRKFVREAFTSAAAPILPCCR